MRIALYHPWIHLRGGGERVIVELVKRLPQHSWTIFTHLYEADKTFPEFKCFNVIVLRNTRIKGVLRRGLEFGLRALDNIPLEDFDLFVVSTGGIGELVNLRNKFLSRKKIPTICYCHTILRPAHDLYDFFLKERYSGIRSIPFKFAVGSYKFFEKLAWRGFDFVFCNSENVKTRILNAGLIDENKIMVLNPGVDVSSFSPSYKYGNYFLYHSRITSYKRFEFVIEAFRKFNNPKFKLVIAGSLSEKDEAYYNKLARMIDDDKNIEIKVNLSDGEYFSLIDNSYACLFSAINEDWGIAPIESQAFAKPVISINEGGPKESIINGVTGFLVNSPDEMTEFMNRLSENKRLVEDIGKKARENSLKYDWSIFADKFDKVIAGVVNES